MGLIGKPGVLIVEDEGPVRDLLVEILSRDYHIIDAADGLDGLAKFMADADNGGGSRIDVVVTDVRMPGMSGVDMYLAIRRRRDVPVVFISGYTADDTSRLLRVLQEDDGTRFIEKPVGAAEVRRSINDLLARHYGQDVMRASEE